MDLTNLNKDRAKSRRKSSIDLSTMVYGKVPPQAKDLEEAVLGAIMLEKSAFDVVAEILKPECFYVDAHQRVFKVMQGLQQKNQPIQSHRQKSGARLLKPLKRSRRLMKIQTSN